MDEQHDADESGDIYSAFGYVLGYAGIAALVAIALVVVVGLAFK